MQDSSNHQHPGCRWWCVRVYAKPGTNPRGGGQPSQGPADLDLHAQVLGAGDDVGAEVVLGGEVLRQQLLDGRRLEHVDAHAGDERHLLRPAR